MQRRIGQKGTKRATLFTTRQPVYPIPGGQGILGHDESVPTEAQLIKGKEGGKARVVLSRARPPAAAPMVRLPESHQEEASQKVSEIRALRKKALSEDETAKRLTLAGTICS